MGMKRSEAGTGCDVEPEMDGKLREEREPLKEREKETHLKENPYEEASFVSRNFFLEWGTEVAKQRDGAKASLLRAVFKVFGKRFLMISFLAFVGECLVKMLQSLCLYNLLIQLIAEEDAEEDGDQEDKLIHGTPVYLSAFGVIVCSVLYVMLMHPYFFGLQRQGMQMRIAICSLVYRKALRLNNRALGRTTVGQMVNLLSNDVNRFDYSLLFLPYLVVGPLQAGIAVAILWPILGVSSLAGTGILSLYVLLQANLGKLFSKLRGKTALLTDERLRIMNEMLPTMRVMKMYTWEETFANLVKEARRREMKFIAKTALLRGLNMALFFVSSKITLFLTFLTFFYSGGQLLPPTVFLSMTLFNSLRGSMTLFFPYGIAGSAEILISLNRLQNFLEEEELVGGSVGKHGVQNDVHKEAGKYGVRLGKMFAGWSLTNDEQQLTLKDITFYAETGQLTAVIGPVGAGKSSLLLSILGELPLTSGTIETKGKVVYASQEPWCFAGTIKENILFGSPFEETKYRKVVNVCCLQKDLDLFSSGDFTVVGERGASLSGGQKARIALARTLYYEADVYLLDDPLSAVDVSVAKQVFEKCIRGYLKDKVVILVTHLPQFFRRASQVIALEDGKCTLLGKYSESSEAFPIELGNGLNVNEDEALGSFYGSRASISSLFEDLPPDEKTESEETEVEAEKVSAEATVIGSVKGMVYCLYTRAGAGPFALFLLLVTNVVTQVLYTGIDYWLSIWTDHESRSLQPWEGTNNDTFEEPQPSKKKSFEEDNLDIYSLVTDLSRESNVLVYTTLVVILFLFSIVRSTCFFVVCIRASINLHNRLMESLIRAPILFFERTPIGVLLNRCSRDLGIVDDLIPPTAFDAFEIFINLLGILIMIIVIDYWAVVPTLLLAGLFVFVREVYIRTARGLKRLEGVTRSPVFSHLALSLHGLPTIRAFGAQETFAARFDHLQDQHTGSWFLFISTGRCFGIVLDWISLVYVVAVTVNLILVQNPKTPSEVGLAVSSALMLTGMFQWGVRQSAELENQMTSVERLHEFSILPTEGESVACPQTEPPRLWPDKGELEFKNVSLQYYPERAPVLNDLTLSIKGGEKIGIVGRTGAGKSSLVAALFRLNEPQGLITIDGIDTKTISLKQLRQRLTIIPQEPVLFKGSVRYNLDPFNEHDDSKLWEVLGQVQLNLVVRELEGGLDALLAGGGSNLSVGQRQLLCLARAVLKQNKILILDEATASVDPKTDQLIQETIKKVFASCTVLTIAHRLQTIMDSDRVLVLDSGRVLEFEQPFLLLERENSRFASMVSNTGKRISSHLKQVARDIYLRQEVEVKVEKLTNSHETYI